MLSSLSNLLCFASIRFGVVLLCITIFIPTILTQHRPKISIFKSAWQCNIILALFPFTYPINNDVLIFGDVPTGTQTEFDCHSMISVPFAQIFYFLLHIFMQLRINNFPFVLWSKNDMILATPILYMISHLSQSSFFVKQFRLESPYLHQVRYFCLSFHFTSRLTDC